MSSLNHPAILQFYGASVNLPKVGILLQYCQKGDITKFLATNRLRNNQEMISKTEKIRILKEIYSGMHYLHTLKIIHKDLKPKILLIDDNKNAKIMDFGLSKLTKNEEKTMTRQIGTSYYMASEVFKGDYSFKCDVFSFAILMYVVITENFFPYGTRTGQTNIMRKVSLDAKFRPKLKNEDFKGCEFFNQKKLARNQNQNQKFHIISVIWG